MRIAFGKDSIMEMCYNGTLVMPQNYAVVTEDEMTYVEGGGFWQSVAYYTVKYGIDIAVNAALGGGTIGLIRNLTKTAKDKLKSAIISALLKWTTARVANFIGGSVLGLILDVGLGSVGSTVAKWLDREDGTVDQQIYFSKIF